MPLQATSGAASYDAFGGGVPSEPNFIESVFSTYLYTGNGSTQTITNGIDLSTKGGLVWIKDRNSGAKGHALFDTARGVNLKLQSQSVNGQFSASNQLTAFNTTGFDLGSAGDPNGSGTTYASWTWRKQAKFFDVVAWSGDGINRTIAHTLGAVPGCIIVKRTDGAPTDPWAVYHRSLTNTQYLVLNTTAATATDATWWNSTTPTSSVFSVGTSASVNASGGTYVAYLFAHDAGGFGLSGTDNVISCGSTDGGKVTLGWEPQWILYKSSNFVGDWEIVDNMRGLPVGAVAQKLEPNTADAEATTSNSITIAADGFTLGAITGTAIYIAIRRGPMKVPTDATKVFKPVARTGTDSSYTVDAGFVVDLNITNPRNKVAETTAPFADRLRGFTTGNVPYLIPSSTATEATGTGGGIYEATQNGVYLYNTIYNNSSTTYVNWMFRRAPSFFDEVCYTGTGVARTITHNLAAVPELMIVKRRTSGTGDFWFVYSASTGNTIYLSLNTTSAVEIFSGIWNDTTPTSTQFTIGYYISQSAAPYVAYLFATCAGVSKVGSYTGTAATLQIDCGFTGGARFVLIKRTDSTGDWYVWDSARGIVAGNDPYLLLNSTAAEVTNTDYVDTYNAGFEISSTAPAAINASGGNFVFLAIA